MIYQWIERIYEPPWTPHPKPPVWYILAFVCADWASCVIVTDLPRTSLSASQLQGQADVMFRGAHAEASDRYLSDAGGCSASFWNIAALRRWTCRMFECRIPFSFLRISGLRQHDSGPYAGSHDTFLEIETGNRVRIPSCVLSYTHMSDRLHLGMVTYIIITIDSQASVPSYHCPDCRIRTHLHYGGGNGQVETIPAKS